MKNNSKRFVKIIVLLAIVDALIMVATFFRAPIRNFFNSIDEEASVENDVLENVENVSVENLGAIDENVDIKYVDAEIKEGWYKTSTGAFKANAVYRSMKFPVIEGMELYISSFVRENATPIACFYNKNNAYIGDTGILTERLVLTDYKLDIPDGAAFVAINHSNQYDYPFEAYFCKKDRYSLLGKKIVNFGDSIFGRSRDTDEFKDESISKMLADKTKATVYNAGFGGCRMSLSKAVWSAFSMVEIANSIVSQDWSVQDKALNGTRANDLPNYFAEAVSMLKNIDFNEIDIVTIAYGTNDFTAEVALDNPSNIFDTSTFSGALRYSIKTIKEAYPNIDVAVCTPTYRFWMDDGYNFVCDSTTQEFAGNKLIDFCNAVSSIGNEYNVHVIDNYHDSGISYSNHTECFRSTDGTHPNFFGRRMIAENMAKELYQEFK